VLQCVAVCAARFSDGNVDAILRKRENKEKGIQCTFQYCSMSQCIAVCCSVLQCVAVCCSVCFTFSDENV